MINALLLTVALSGIPESTSVKIEIQSSQVTYHGLGVVVKCLPEGANVLTVAHLDKGVKKPLVVIKKDNKPYQATLLKKDYQSDLALYFVKDLLNEEVALAEEIPPPLTRALSIGREKKMHVSILRHDKADYPHVLVSNYLEPVGNSGGGLFFNDQLIGIIKEHRTDGVINSLYIDAPTIKEFIDE